MKSSFKTIFLLTCFFFNTTVQAQAEERTAASELLKVTQFEQLMDNSISHTIDLLKQMDPEMAKHEEALKEFYSKYMSAESLQDEMINLYNKIFTEEELRDIISFYKTETGQKALNQLPQMMTFAEELVQKRITANMTELESIFAEK